MAHKTDTDWKVSIEPDGNILKLNVDYTGEVPSIKAYTELLSVLGEWAEKNRATMKPAIFNTEMVRAILDGRKTHMRRTIKKYIYEPNPRVVRRMIETGNLKQPYKVGDIIYVRETFGTQIRTRYGGVGEFLVYRADYQNKELQHEGYPAKFKNSFVKWKPSIHMPKKYARLFLRLKDVRIERLNEISEEDAIAEGCWYGVGSREIDPPLGKDLFPNLWESIYGNGSFDNRYVWVIEFELISKEEAMK